MIERNTLNIKKFKIAVLEDSPFYNNLLKKQFDDYFENLGVITDSIFSIRTFLNTDDFLENLSEDTDVALLDYYLQNGETALNVIGKIKDKTDDCKIIIISGSTNARIYCKEVWSDVVNFVLKDLSAPKHTCKLIESIFLQKYKPNVLQH